MRGITNNGHGTQTRPVLIFSMLLQGMLFGGFNDMDVAGDCNIDFHDVTSTSMPVKRCSVIGTRQFIYYDKRPPMATWTLGVDALEQPFAVAWRSGDGTHNRMRSLTGSCRLSAHLHSVVVFHFLSSLKPSLTPCMQQTKTFSHTHSLARSHTRTCSQTRLFKILSSLHTQRQ